MSYFRAFLNSPVGPKTTHFWGPMANWGFVISGVMDSQKPPDAISGNMTSVLCVYSLLCMRFAWMVRPRNYLLLACHASNESVQLYQLSRWLKHQRYLSQKEENVSSWRKVPFFSSSINSTIKKEIVSYCKRVGYLCGIDCTTVSNGWNDAKRWQTIALMSPIDLIMEHQDINNSTMISLS